MAESELITRPLTAAEQRWLRLIAVRRERFLLAVGPYMMLLVGIVLFGGLWGLTVLATKAEKTGPSWRVSGLIWLGLGIVIGWWAYRDVRPHAHVLQERFRSALRQNTACEIRVRSKMVIQCVNKQDRKKSWYAFQIDDGHVVFISARFSHRLRRFPTSDFSMVDIADEKGRVVAGYVRNHGNPIAVTRTISYHEAAALRVPDHMEIMRGDLKEIDKLLGVHTCR